MFYLPIMLTGSMLFRKAMKFHAGLQRERKSDHASDAGKTNNIPGEKYEFYSL